MQLCGRLFLLTALIIGSLSLLNEENAGAEPQLGLGCHTFETTQDQCLTGCSLVDVQQFPNGEGAKRLDSVWVECDAGPPACANYMSRAVDNPACCDRDDDSYRGTRPGCGTGSDCNDDNPSINPGAFEAGQSSGGLDMDCSLCQDGLDNDCDQLTDYQDPGCYFTCGTSPIVVDTSGDGFNLTSASAGVMFDIKGTGQALRVAWVQGDDAWLALDRNGNGTIDDGKELFGNFTQQPPSSNPNGFLALAEFDKPTSGGDGNGKINRQDAIFSTLRLWQDTDHNGVSGPSELHSLQTLGVAIIDLDYKETRRRDEHGNWFRYRAKVRDIRGAHVGRWAWDVFLVSQ